MQELIERFNKSGFSYTGFMEFVNSKEPDTRIDNGLLSSWNDCALSSWNDCAVGSYLKSIGINDDFNKHHNMEVLNEMFLQHQFPGVICTNLNNSRYHTYGKLQGDFAKYVEPFTTLEQYF